MQALRQALDEHQGVHWADRAALALLKKKPDQKEYVLASGITPSGVVHVGNFREIISTELVQRALQERGKRVRFVFSWDDYDVFRKVPKDLPKQETFARYLRLPITKVPDPYTKESSYAAYFEKALERKLPLLGIEPQYLYQSQKYQGGLYLEQIRLALTHRYEIRKILNQFRENPLDENWFPVSIFSPKTHKDTTKILAWDGQYCLEYEEEGEHHSFDLRKDRGAKLLWRVDWPMRWAFEGVDFEPAGKDHHSKGGSFDTARSIVRFFGGQAPQSFKYDFVSIKGIKGKISSSSGAAVSLDQVLQVYTPQLARYLFVKTRPDREFSISFDLDVLKVYEDYDKTERCFFGAKEFSKERLVKEKRIYQLSQIKDVPKNRPFVVSFRHLANILQIHQGNVDRALDFLKVPKETYTLVEQRAHCAWNWVRLYAPEEFCFTLRTEPGGLQLSPKQKAFLKDFKDFLEVYHAQEESKTVAKDVQDLALKHTIESKEAFKVIYLVLINKEQGPRLGSFLKSIDLPTLRQIIEFYL